MLETAAPAREPPRIIVVAPPPSHIRKVAIVFLWVAGGLLVLTAILVAILSNNPRVQLILAGVLGGNGLIFGIIAACMFPVGARQDRESRRAAAELKERYGEDPIVESFAKVVADRRHNRFPARLAKLGPALPPETPGRARIVCIGRLELPDAGPYLFEPEVISPTRYLGRYWIAVAIGVAIMLLMAVRVSGLVGWLNFFPIGAIGSFGYFYVMAIIFGGLWIWRTTIRPTYIRLAPGIIQVLRYRFRGGKPDVADFPMEDGTSAMIFCTSHFNGAARPAILYLLRGGNVETIHLAQLSRETGLITRFWEAMLSTAPKPPLSNEELVG